MIAPTQVGQPDAARCVTPLGCEQTGFECQQTQGVLGFDADGRRHARICMEPGGKINGQDRRSTSVHSLDPCGHGAVGCACLRAQAQHGINTEIGVVWRCLRKGNAHLKRSLVSGCRVLGRQLGLPCPGDDGLFAPLLQVHGRFQSVAAVIAWAAGYPDTAAVRCQRERQLGHRQTRPLHQGVGRQC